MSTHRRRLTGFEPCCDRLNRNATCPSCGDHVPCDCVWENGHIIVGGYGNADRMEDVEAGLANSSGSAFYTDEEGA